MQNLEETMSVSAGIWSGSTQPTSQPIANASESADSGSSSSATISANDFLTLLVTEMQNQDPTADTDPNEYINQLVNVNSLEQLISINQTLQSATSGSTSATIGADAINPNPTKGTSSGPANESVHVLREPGAAVPSSATNPAAASMPGNLGIPKFNPAATRVAQGLLGR
jgi:flagellar basal-body rod modification protein FlgD